MSRRKCAAMNCTSNKRTNPSLRFFQFPTDSIRHSEGVTFTINGHVYHAGGELNVDTSLNTFIREYANLKGTKYMCKEGGCGACIVAMTVSHPHSQEDITYAVNSCLVPVLSCHGAAITTIEGIGSKIKGYHKIQRVLSKFNGTQCGYCSPGMVMNMYSLFRFNPRITMEEVENSFGGSICRCTGYRPILDAFKSLTINATKELKDKVIDIEDIGAICKIKNGGCEKSCTDCKKRERKDSDDDYSKLFLETALAPKHLKLKLGGGMMSWYRVTSVRQIFELFDYIGDVSYMLVAGNTAQGVYKEPPSLVYIDIADVAELHGIQVYPDRVVLGANVTLTEMILFFEKISNQNPLLFGYMKKLAEHIDLVANVPVRNIASLAGNLMIKHKHREFPSDIFLILETCGALITIRDSIGLEDTMPLIQFLELNMFKKLILCITVPALSSNHYTFRSFKIMPRRQNVHAYVNAGFLFRIQWRNNCIVEETPTIVFGSISPDFVHAYQTQSYLTGRSLVNNSVITNAVLFLSKELRPVPEPPEASPLYRRNLAISLFYKFILGVNGEKARAIYQSGAEDLIRPLSSGIQEFPKSNKEAPVHQPVDKIEGPIQCSGEAEYIDDLPKLPQQLYGALVITDRARAKIVQIDASYAKKVPGIVDFLTAKDIPGTNSFAVIDGLISSEEEELFCSGDVLYAGQPVGMIVAATQELAIQAAKTVKIIYSSQVKPLLTIKEVLESGDKSRVVLRGHIEPEDTQGNIAHKIFGELELGSQYHYTMELQTCVCVPIEDGLNVFSSTQWLHGTQAAIAKVLNLPLNCINVKVKRVGGAYGAKISRSAMIATACSLAAHKLQHPVRMALDLETNMKAIGKRCPFYAKYEVAVDDHGRIQYLNLDMYEDMGCSFNDNVVIFLRDAVKNCYDFSNWTVNMYLVKTDTPSSTWTRAPGSLEGMAAIEHIMEHIATVCQCRPLDIRRINFSNDSRKDVEEILQEIIKSSDYDSRLKVIQQFNSTNRWRKKGISVMPMKFDIIFFPGFHSMVSIFHDDGTVAISTGGIEIGQGINTKVAQACAYALGVDMKMIKIKPCDNIISPNDKPTSASIASDTVTYATLKCCEELNKRLLPVKERIKNPTWLNVLKQANLEGINLNASYMYTSTDPVPKPYSVFGATVLEVEVDILTGQYQISRADILEDAGESLSPNIDIGQIEGAFVMGLGYFSSERIVYDDKNGALLTNRTWTYWPPGAKDIPIDFRVKMKTNSSNPRGVLRSKATGEPPLCMSLTLVMALRHALRSARNDAGHTDEWFNFDPPCTFETTFLSADTSLQELRL